MLTLVRVNRGSFTTLAPWVCRISLMQKMDSNLLIFMMFTKDKPGTISSTALGIPLTIWWIMYCIVLRVIICIYDAWLQVRRPWTGFWLVKEKMHIVYSDFAQMPLMRRLNATIGARRCVSTLTRYCVICMLFRRCDWPKIRFIQIWSTLLVTDDILIHNL